MRNAATEVVIEEDDDAGEEWVFFHTDYWQRVPSDGSQFYVTMSACGHLDGKNVVIGQVLSGFACVKELQGATPARGRVPAAMRVVVEECGEVQGNAPPPKSKEARQQKATRPKKD